MAIADLLLSTLDRLLPPAPSLDPLRPALWRLRPRTGPYRSGVRQGLHGEIQPLGR